MSPSSTSAATRGSLGGTHARCVGLVTAVLLLAASGSAAAGQIIINALDKGYYTNVGDHDPTNTNYFVGNFASPSASVYYYRNFFVFELESYPETIIGAELRINMPPVTGGYSSADATETYEVYDVSTPIATLRAGGTATVGIFEDLGGGIVYGNVVTSEADTGTTVVVALNATFTSLVQTAGGSEIAVGGAITSVDADDLSQESIFGGSSNFVAQLVLFTSGTPTATHTATPALAPTITPTPTTTLTSAATPTAAPTMPPHITDPDAAKAADKCAGRVAKASGTFVVKRLKSLEKCADGVFKCLQTKPPGAKRDACMEKARVKREKELAKVAGEGTKLARTVDKSCGGLAIGDVAGDEGLALASLADACDTRFQIIVDDAASAAACIRAHHQCTAEQMFMLQMPRVDDLLGLAGVPPLDCTFGVGGDDDVGDAALGKQLEKCQKAIKKAGASFVKKKLKALQTCVDGVLGCVQLKSGDDFASCIVKARSRCDKAFGTIAAAAGALAPAIEKRCADIGAPLFAAEGVGLGGGVPQKQCPPYGVPTPGTLAEYAECLFRQHECLVEELVAFETPRAAELLGLVDRELRSVFCPSP